MFGLGLGEILIIAVLALVLIGPKRLPEAGRKIGEFYRQFRDAADTVKNTVTQDLDVSEVTEPEPRSEPTEPEPRPEPTEPASLPTESKDSDDTK